MKSILKYPKLLDAVVVNRPSKINKSPYLIDIKINNKVEMCHSPGLGLSGLIRPGIKSIAHIILNKLLIFIIFLLFLMFITFLGSKKLFGCV